MIFNQDDQVAVLRTPYDDEIERLGRALNDTYIYYGVEGRQAWDRRGKADRAALKMAPAGAAVERTLFKSKNQYAESVAGMELLYILKFLRSHPVPIFYNSAHEQTLCRHYYGIKKRLGHHATRLRRSQRLRR